MTEPVKLPKNTSEESSAVEPVFDSVKVSLADLCAKGRAQYTQKNYEQATDFYSRATELQAELNGEMNPENAEILFLYGRSLFKLGQSKSDVLGGGSSSKRKKRNSFISPTASAKNGDIKEEKCKEIGNNIQPQDTALESVNQRSTPDIKKELFQFKGDENFEESDQEALDGEEEEEEENEDDDLAAAFDVLDLARILFEKKLKVLLEKSEKKEKTIEDTSMTKHYRERLADTHDLLAEISLENESFSAAVTDCRAALAYKKELYTEEQSVIAEAHFKLSLALEFASITSTTKDDKIENNEVATAPEIDQTMRNEAVTEMEAAIKSTNLKIQTKEAELSKLDSPDEIEIMRNQISEVKEMYSELQSRLEELQGPAIDVKSVLYGSLTGERGILSASSATLAKSSDDAVVARIEEARKTALDVTGLVRKKAKATTTEDSVTTRSSNLSEKRKIESTEESDSKRTKVDVRAA